MRQARLIPGKAALERVVVQRAALFVIAGQVLKGVAVVARERDGHGRAGIIAHDARPVGGIVARYGAAIEREHRPALPERRVGIPRLFHGQTGHGHVRKGDQRPAALPVRALRLAHEHEAVVRLLAHAVVRLAVAAGEVAAGHALGQAGPRGQPRFGLPAGHGIRVRLAVEHDGGERGPSPVFGEVFEHQRDGRHLRLRRAGAIALHGIAVHARLHVVGHGVERPLRSVGDLVRLVEAPAGLDQLIAVDHAVLVPPGDELAHAVAAPLALRVHDRHAAHARARAAVAGAAGEREHQRLQTAVAAVVGHQLPHALLRAHLHGDVHAPAARPVAGARAVRVVMVVLPALFHDEARALEHVHGDKDAVLYLQPHRGKRGAGRAVVHGVVARVVHGHVERRAAVVHDRFHHAVGKRRRAAVRYDVRGQALEVAGLVPAPVVGGKAVRAAERAFKMVAVKQRRVLRCVQRAFKVGRRVLPRHRALGLHLQPELDAHAQPQRVVLDGLLGPFFIDVAPLLPERRARLNAVGQVRQRQRAAALHIRAALHAAARRRDGVGLGHGRFLDEIDPRHAVGRVLLEPRAIQARDRIRPGVLPARRVVADVIVLPGREPLRRDGVVHAALAVGAARDAQHELVRPIAERVVIVLPDLPPRQHDGGRGLLPAVGERRLHARRLPAGGRLRREAGNGRARVGRDRDGPPVEVARIGPGLKAAQLVAHLRHGIRIGGAVGRVARQVLEHERVRQRVGRSCARSERGLVIRLHLGSAPAQAL